MGFFDSLMNVHITDMSVKSEFSNRLEILIREFGLQKNKLLKNLEYRLLQLQNMQKEFLCLHLKLYLPLLIILM